MNASLTLLRDRISSRFGRFITQSLAWAARAASTLAGFVSRAATSFVETMDDIERIFMERVYERRMAVRSLFLNNARDVNSGYNKPGKLLLAHLARHCKVFAPTTSNDPIEIAKMNGRQEVLALILADLYDDLPDFARLMAQEERRRSEEIVPA